jgi:hypothetical protein
MYRACGERKRETSDDFSLAILLLPSAKYRRTSAIGALPFSLRARARARARDTSRKKRDEIARDVTNA